MVLTSHPQREAPKLLVQFIQQKLGLSESAIKLGLRHAEIEQAPLPIVLWRFGLLSLAQFQEVLDWEFTQE